MAANINATEHNTLHHRINIIYIYIYRADRLLSVCAYSSGRIEICA